MSDQIVEVVNASEDKCRDIKHGRIELHCILPRGHDGWHEADYRDHQIVTYDGARHEVTVTEHVTWEPVDHVKEAVKHLMAGRRQP